VCCLATSTARASTRKPFHYAVLISKQAAGDPRWNEVATVLAGKYPGARIFTYDRLDELVGPMKAFSPDYIAFVRRPQDATPEFVRQAGRFNRKLENEPYGTAVWAIVTGYDHEDALRIARNGAPPAINFGLGGMLGFLDSLHEGVAYSEFTDAKQDWQEKKAGLGVRSRHDAPEDHMVPMIKLVNGNEVDGVWTSGHAGKDMWSVYYPEGPAVVVAENGGLTGFLDGEARAPIRSTNPKVYLAIGNCLTARIEDPDQSYALSWIHSGGAYQYFGFIEETYYGLMGWSMADNFFYRGARFNVAESAFVANQSLLLAMNERLAPDEVEDMAYDRDATVVYGDPAWMATVPEATARSVEHWSTRVDRSIAGKKIRWELTVTFKKESEFSPGNGKDLRPVFAFLPERVKKPRALRKSPDVSAFHVASNFVVVNFTGRVAAGETRKFVFESEP
jgi:zinc protease